MQNAQRYLNFVRTTFIVLINYLAWSSSSAVNRYAKCNISKQLHHGQHTRQLCLTFGLQIRKPIPSVSALTTDQFCIILIMVLSSDLTGHSILFRQSFMPNSTGACSLKLLFLRRQGSIFCSTSWDRVTSPSSLFKAYSIQQPSHYGFTQSTYGLFLCSSVVDRYFRHSTSVQKATPAWSWNMIGNRFAQDRHAISKPTIDSVDMPSHPLLPAVESMYLHCGSM